MKTTKSSWRFLARPVPGEHSLWEREGDNRVFIADCSGGNPDQTEDGPLALDTELTLEKGYSRAISAFVGATRDDGNRCSTMLHVEVAQWLIVNRKYLPCRFTVKLGDDLARARELLRAALE